MSGALFTKTGICRQRFADIPLDEVAGAMESNDIDELEHELGGLVLLADCRRAVARRRRGPME